MFISRLKSFSSSLPRKHPYAFWRKLEQSPVSYRLARGAFWNLVGTLVFRGLAFFASVCAARILGKEAFGELGILQSTFGMFGVLAGFGLGLTSTKYVSELRDVAPDRAGRIITLSACTAWVMGTISAVGLAMLAPWLAAHTLAAPHIAGDLAVGALLVLLGAVNGTQTGILSGFEAFKRAAVVNFWAGLANFPCLTAGCYFFGVRGAVWGLVCAQAIACVLNRVAIGSEARRYGIELRTRGWQSEIGVLWRFSVPSLIGSALYVPSNWVCAALLVNQPHGYAEMGAFSAAAQIYGLLLFLPNIVGNVAFPVMSGDTSPTAGDAYRALSLSLKASMLVAVFPALLCLPFSTSVARLFGDSFDENTAVFMVALLAAMPLACFFPYQRFLSARGFAWAATGANLVHSILYVALGLKFVNHGALGLIWARFLAHSADGAYSFLMTKLYKPTKGHLRSFEAIDRDPGMYPQRQS